MATFGFNRTVLRATQPKLHSMLCVLFFEDPSISRRADVVWPFLWGAVKDKCYTDKPETIDALKDNIREAIGEIQLHTMLKNCTDSVGYCMASRDSHLNEIIFY